MCLYYTGAPVPTNTILHEQKSENLNSIFRKELPRLSFTGKSPEMKSNITKTYYKFLMYRNPAERLVSAYLDKIASGPMVSVSKVQWNSDRKLIYQRVHPIKYQEWQRSGARVPINITFTDFVEAMIITGGLKNEHYQTTFDLCSPCKIRYSYYGNFKFFNRDVGVFNDRIHGNRSNIRTAYSRVASSIAPDYYSQITDQQKMRLVNLLARDFVFYYTVFPEERDSHKTIMGTDYDIPMQEVLL